MRDVDAAPELRARLQAALAASGVTPSPDLLQRALVLAAYYLEEFGRLEAFDAEGAPEDRDDG